MQLAFPQRLRHVARPGAALVLAALIACCVVVGAATAATSAKQPIVIGFIGALSGPNAPDNTAMLDVEKQVAASVNAKGGVNGHQVQIISADDQGSPAEARVLALKMVQQNHVAALAGPLYSTEALTVAQISSQLKVPIVALQASVEQVVYPYGRNQKPYPWVFASGVSAVAQMQRMFQFCIAHGWKRVALIYQNDSFGTTDLPEFLAQAQADKLQIVLNRAIDATATDATPQAVAIQGANAKAVISWTNAVATAALAKSMHNSGLDIPLMANISNNSSSFLSLAGSAANGIYVPGYKAAFATTGPVPAFSAAFQKEWGFGLRSNFYPVIDGLNAYLAAVKQATTPKKGKPASSTLPKPGVVQKILQKSTYKGIVETVQYTATQHDVYDSSAMLITRANASGQFVPVN